MTTVATFTDRELQVLEVIRDGARTYPHIADLLEPRISRHTAEMHVRNIAAKLLEEGLAEGPPLFRVTLYALRTLEPKHLRS